MVGTSPFLHPLPFPSIITHVPTPSLAPPQVDYETQRLQFKVGVNGGEAVKDMKSLSGGERSFATVCFVMALGESWGPLDES